MKRFKVLLMKPYSEADELLPPISLGYLATAIRDSHEVVIVDGLKEMMTIDKFKEYLSGNHFDVIGVQIFTFQVSSVREYLKAIKELLPRAIVVLGGPHPSCSPTGIFDLFPQINFAFRGEAEVGFASLLQDLAKGDEAQIDFSSIPGLIWQQSSQTIVNTQAFPDDLDKLGMPSWDLLDFKSYPLAPHGGFFKNKPIAPLIISRGCPFSCTYCAGPVIGGRRVRYRSVDHIMREIEILYNDYGVREIHIEDDNFTMNQDLVFEFCRRLKSSGLKITWTCPNGIRLDTLTKELLLAMKDAGLYSVSVGIESGSERILKDMKKSLTLDKIREKISLINSCGLGVSGFFIIGYPTETLEDIKKTIKFSLSLGLKRAGFSLFKPFPGTVITESLVNNGQLPVMSDDDWSRFVLADTVFSPPGISKEQLVRLRKLALIRFYFRPKIIWQFFSEINSLGHFRLILKRMYSWLIKAK
jgi:radical SAM superfamily enzyme YgiQ (UPF0313 family)